MKIAALEIQLKTLPECPGVYKFFNRKKNILYIGKAKNLKKRVSSYFNKNHKNFKTNILVRQIFIIENIVVETEMDALLLENNLIKKYKPKYNVLLKDDKTYPWICIKKHPKPRIFYTRKIEENSDEYFGPFTSVKNVKFLIQLIKDLYPFLNHELIHLLKNTYQENEINLYDKNIKSIKALIKGNFKECVRQFKKEMNNFSAKMEFENAQKIKEKIGVLNTYQSKSTIVNPKITNTDVFTVFSDKIFAYVNYMQISYGSINSSYTIEIKKKLNESDRKILKIAIIELRKRFNSVSKEILTQFKIDLPYKINCIVPKLGDKKNLIALSLKNTKSFRLERFKQIQILDPAKHTKRLLNQIRQDLKLSKTPFHIECFDNSNLQGTNPVAACVVFKNCKPSKKDYRHYDIKSVKGPNDFASMEEIIFRRYTRLLNERKNLPQLIVIDGGKGQVSSAVKSINKLNLSEKISIIGIAKKLEKIYFPNDSVPIYLDKKSETLRIIQQLRNEAHRFGIKLHRKKRNQNSLTSILDEITGIGKKTKESLLKEYKSFKNISKASLEDLSFLIGPSKAKKIINLTKKKSS